VILTPTDHKHLVRLGMEIVDVVNTSCEEHVIGDLYSDELHSFWFRMNYNFCSDYFMLYPPKKNLEANLLNRINSLKHTKAMDDQWEKTKGSLLLSG
jgi:hypothetical protein